MTQGKHWPRFGLAAGLVAFALLVACIPAPTAAPPPTATPIPPPPPTATITPVPKATSTPKPARLEDGYEPDNDFSQAHTITAAELHNFCGPKEEDWVKFQAAAGQTYHIKADPPSNFQTEPHLELYNNWKVVAQNDHYFGNIAEIWWFNNGADTTAYVRVTELKGRADCGSSTYTLSVQAGKP